MNKTQLIDYVAASSGLRKGPSAEAVQAALEGIAACLRRGEEVTLFGFGNFRFRVREARVGRNPRTGASVNIPAKRTVFFSAAGRLKQDISLVTGPTMKTTASKAKAKGGAKKRDDGTLF